jgi:hypothetical protein
VNDSNPWEYQYYADPFNPYREETRANTSTTWLGDQQPVDVDPEGLSGYAGNMVTIMENLMSHQTYLTMLASVPHQAWEGPVLGDAGYARARFLANYTELMNYLSHLALALNNIGNAAQTVADAYSGTDGHSAADLNAVLFAFGVPGANRPAGLPSIIGKTYFQDLIERRTQGGESAAAPAMFGDEGTWDERTNADGSVTQIAHGPNGQRMEITSFSIPGGGGTVTTTVIYGSGGRVLSRTSENRSTYMDGNSVVTSTTTSSDGRRTGSTTETVTYGDGGRVTSESTENVQYGPDGSEAARSSTTTTTESDGSQVTEQRRGDEVIRRTEVGEQTSGGGATRPDSPAADATRRVNDH